MSFPDHIHSSYIGAGAEDVWQAIVDPHQPVRYFYGTRIESTWSPRDPVRYLYPDGSVAADGEVITYSPGKRLEITFHARWDADLEAEGPVRQVWDLDETDGVTKLTVETYDMPADSRRHQDFTEGIPCIVSGRKTLVETGRGLGE